MNDKDINRALSCLRYILQTYRDSRIAQIVCNAVPRDDSWERNYEYDPYFLKDKDLLAFLEQLVLDIKLHKPNVLGDGNGSRKRSRSSVI